MEGSDAIFGSERFEGSRLVGKKFDCLALRCAILQLGWLFHGDPIHSSLPPSVKAAEKGTAVDVHVGRQ